MCAIITGIDPGCRPMNEQVKTALASLHRGQQVTVIYDGKFEQKRLSVTGKVVNVDTFWQTFQFNKVAIDFSEIYGIIR